MTSESDTCLPFANAHRESAVENESRPRSSRIPSSGASPRASSSLRQIHRSARPNNRRSASKDNPSSSESDLTTRASSMALRVRAGEFADSIRAFTPTENDPVIGSTTTGATPRPPSLQPASRLNPSTTSSSPFCPCATRIGRGESPSSRTVRSPRSSANDVPSFPTGTWHTSPLPSSPPSTGRTSNEDPSRLLMACTLHGERITLQGRPTARRVTRRPSRRPTPAVRRLLRHAKEAGKPPQEPPAASTEGFPAPPGTENRPLSRRPEDPAVAPVTKVGEKSALSAELLTPSRGALPLSAAAPRPSAVRSTGGSVGDVAHDGSEHNARAYGTSPSSIVGSLSA